MSNFRIYNDQLCSELWDSAQHLDPRIRINLLRMASDFYEKTNLPAPIADVYLMGSIANYNWTTDSDIDVHVIIDYTKLQMPEETRNKTVKTAGAQWNQEHNIFIKGHKVEMNLQDSAEPKPYVTGIYSLMRDQWIRQPFKMAPNLDRNVIQFQYKSMKAYIDNALRSGDREQMKAAKKYLDAYRQYGLDTYGELSYENIIFKILRSRGIIKQLKDSITAVYDKQMSVDEADYIGSTFMNKVEATEVPDALKTVHHIHGMASGNNSQNWRYLESRNTVLWNTQPTRRDKVAVAKWLASKGISPVKHRTMHRENLNEVGEKSMNYRLPQTPMKYADSGMPRLDTLTLDNLNALRAKAARMVKATSNKDDSISKEINQQAMQDFIYFNAEIKKRLETINRPITEMPHISKKGKQVMAGDEPLKGQNVEKVVGNIAVIRQGKSGGFIPEGWTLVYFMDTEESAHDMLHGKIPYAFIPTGTFLSGGSPITDIWKKKFTGKPGQEHILGIIQGNSDTQSIFIDMISVRPGFQRNHIAKLMMDRLRKTFPEAQITTSSRTDKGEKFAKGYGIDEGNKNIPKSYKVNDEYGCLTNAENLAKLNPNLKYVEGYCKFPNGKWGSHAWCETPNGEIIDPYFEKKFGAKQKQIIYRKAKANEDPFDRLEEGVGAGIPEDDRLNIQNQDGSVRRWQIRSKDAPKTPKMTDIPPRAIKKFDKPQETL